MAAEQYAGLRRRFLILRAARWLPMGLLIPILVLLLTDRGFTLGQIGLGMAAQGTMVFLLELPTGGLADSLGRRPVYFVATALSVVALVLMLSAQSIVVLIAAYAVFGAYRALESGPLDAWFVDEAQRLDPDVDIQPALGASGVATSIAIAIGALGSSALVALDPIDSVDALALPLALSAVLSALELVLIGTLMKENVDSDSNEPRPRISQVVSETLRMVRSSRVLAALVAVEFLWGFGMVSFETLLPLRLTEVTTGTERAAQILGPAVTAAWIASALGAALAPRLAKRVGTPVAAMALHGLQAVMVFGMAIVAGPVGVVAFYLITLGAHGAINPLYLTLLHAQAEAKNRATVLSAASMAAHPGGAIGGISLGLLADATSVSAAMIVGGIVLLLTIPLYGPARGQTLKGTA